MRMDTLVRLSIDNQVATITLNRPEVHNAFNEQVIQDLTRILDDLSRSADTRVIVLASNGESFSAGGDIEWMKKSITYSKDENRSDAKRLARMFRAIRESPKPVIARVQGAALGGGVGLVAVSDIAVSLASATFSFSEVKLGILPAVISPFVIEKIGAGPFRRYALTAERFDAEKAKTIGLISEVVHSIHELDEKILEFCTLLRKNGPKALTACKHLLNEISHYPWDKSEAFTAEQIAEIRVSPEGQEGLRAFLERRKPNWLSD